LALRGECTDDVVGEDAAGDRTEFIDSHPDTRRRG
jgi:hypothetical protein